MGWVKKIGHWATGGVTKAAKVVTGSVKNSLRAVFNPVRLTKDLLRNPLGTVARMSMLDTLFNVGGGVTATQMERQQAGTQPEDDSLSSADRARMISRQSMQGANPIMLLGQDFRSDELNRDQELGGDRR